MAFINVHLRHLNLSDIKLSDIDIILYDDLNQNFTLFDIWKNTGEKNMNNIQLHNDLNDSKQTINKQFISFDCYLETLIIYNYIKLMYQTVSIYDIIKYINMLTKNLKKNKFSCSIVFYLEMCLL